MAFTRVGEIHGESSITEMVLFGPTPPVRSTTKAKTGAYSIRTTFGVEPFGLGIPSLATGIRTGFFLNHNNISANANIFRVHETLTSTWPIELVWMEDELRLDLIINGSIEDQVDISSIGFNITDQWFHFGVTADQSSYVSVYLDGIQILTYSGTVSGAGWDAVAYTGNRETNAWVAYGYVDDIYLDKASSESDAAPPAYQFFPAYVDGAGSNSGWTQLSGSNYQMVDDGAVDDGDTTVNRVTTSAGSLKDTFEVDDVVLPADYVIEAVHAWCVARKLNAADDAQIYPILYDGLNYGKGGSAKDAPVWWSYLRERFETQPDASPWNEIDFNGMEAGYEAGGSF